ncbi:hypothetical protein ABK040_015473 [Willaertia magna]
MGVTKNRSNEPSISYSQFCSYTHKLNPSGINAALQLRRQGETWSCGPNSAARALTIINSMSLSNVSSFIENCPKSFGNPTLALYASGVLAGALFGPIGALVGLGAGLALDTVSTKFPVGPTPTTLASYSGGKCYHSDSFDGKFIENSIDSGKPIVVLLMFRPTSLHYVNVIAYDNDDYVILDDNSIRLFPKSYMNT